MKTNFIMFIAAMMLFAAGCQKKEENKTEIPKAPAQAVMPQATPQAAVPEASQQKPTAPAEDPHTAFKNRDVAAGSGHKGKVLETMDAAGYTYVQVEENGQKLWVASMQTPVKKGDMVEFPNSPPMENFTSKTLKRTFDKIIFAEALRVVK